jgi:hypothetical protein
MCGTHRGARRAAGNRPDPYRSWAAWRVAWSVVGSITSDRDFPSGGMSEVCNESAHRSAVTIDPHVLDTPGHHRFPGPPLPPSLATRRRPGMPAAAKRWDRRRWE